MSRRGRRWCWTLWKTDDATLDDLRLLPWDPESKVRGVAFQKEVCPDSKREHIQGYTEFYEPMRFHGFLVAMRFTVGEVNCRCADGNQESNLAYVSKIDSRAPGALPEREGDFKLEPGKRNDLNEFCKEIKEGKTDMDLAEDFPGTYLRYYKHAAHYRSTVLGDRDGPIQAYCYWGEPGTGKTTAAAQRADASGMAIYRRTADKGWWDGYSGEGCVIMEDFDCRDYDFAKLLLLLEPGKMKVPVKGGFVNMRATLFLFTSNEHPKYWYAFTAYNKGQLARRFSEVIEVERDVGDLNDWKDSKMSL